MSLNLPEYIIKNYPFDLEKIYKNKLPKDMALTKKIYLAAIKQDRYIFSHLPEELIYDREVCLTAVTYNGEALNRVPWELRDKEICLAAVTENGEALDEVPAEIIDREICIVAVSNSVRAIYSVPRNIRYELERRFRIRYDANGPIRNGD